MYCNLTKLQFKTIYSEPAEVADFYSKALRQARVYKRVSAYFSFGIFNYLKKGLPDFINNDGYMQLILSTEIDKETIDEINKGYRLKQDQKNALLSKKEIIETIQSLSNEDNASLFAYLIAVGKLDIKIACKMKGIVHDKFGCISDGVHGLVYVGSNNFSENGVRNNDELFTVTIDWDSPSKREIETITDVNRLFDDMWGNKKDGVITIDMPDPVVEEMINKIDYEEIKSIKKNPDFIRLDINDDKEIILTSNINISNLMVYRNIGEYISFLRNNGKDFRIHGLDRTTEIFNFKTIMNNVCEQNNLSFYLTKRASDYFDLHYRNYNELALKGTEIKSPYFRDSEGFDFYSDTINGYLLRPLKDMQIVAASHIIEMEKSLNFSVPGSGKTATILGAFEYLANLSISDKRHVDKLLIVGPKNCSKSWKDEYLIVSPESRKHSPLCLINDDDTLFEKMDVLLHDFDTSRVIIVNYELVPKIKNELLQLVDSKVMVVFDEIHRIKKTDSAKFEALKDIVFNTRYRVALTGTPLPNGYVDLLNMIRLLHDDYAGSYFGMFESSLRSDDTRYRKTGLQNDELNKLLEPFYIRITKKDLKVPLAEPDHLIYVQTNNREKDLYRKIIKNESNSFESTIKLVEIGCVPFKCDQSIDKFEDNTIDFSSIDVKPYMTSKLYKLLNVVKENNRKCVIWCNFVDTINLVTAIMNQNGFKAKAIYGGTPQDEREKIIDEFNYSNLLDILVTNPATLAESVSLHKSCHDAHYIELNYNLYQYLQSRDRIHRLGLKDTDKTNYYLYFNFYDDDMKESKDKDIYDALQKKNYLMQRSIENGNFAFGDDTVYGYK